jgi:pyruvate/2-oxoglutarate dehydrogenase complex dihydrolipoamide acyltransferase (E2) component
LNTIPDTGTNSGSGPGSAADPKPAAAPATGTGAVLDRGTDTDSQNGSGSGQASGYDVQLVPRSRIATFDVYAVGQTRHHIASFLEFDVTESRRVLRELRKTGTEISFNGWLISVISTTLHRHREAAAWLKGKKRLILFRSINVSVMVEKTVGGSRVPLPVVIERAETKSPGEITSEIEKAKKQVTGSGDVVLGRKPKWHERLYYHLPGLLRRWIWRRILASPEFAFRNMGNVMITSPGMMGRINGWFLHRSIHPVSFGVGSILRKPVVVGDAIVAREVLNMTILLDHDVIDGAPMVRFITDLTQALESGSGLTRGIESGSGLTTKGNIPSVST